MYITLSNPVVILRLICLPIIDTRHISPELSWIKPCLFPAFSLPPSTFERCLIQREVWSWVLFKLRIDPGHCIQINGMRNNCRFCTTLPSVWQLQWKFRVCLWVRCAVLFILDNRLFTQFCCGKSQCVLFYRVFFGSWLNISGRGGCYQGINLF